MSFWKIPEQMKTPTLLRPENFATLHNGVKVSKILNLYIYYLGWKSFIHGLFSFKYAF